MKYCVWNREPTLFRLVLETDDPDKALDLAEGLSLDQGYSYVTGWEGGKLAYIGNWLKGIEYINFIKPAINKLLCRRR